MVGMTAAPLSSWCYLALPLSGISGFACALGLALLRCRLGIFSLQAFWAQHVWDQPIDSAGDEDWGRHNASSCYSWWPTKADAYLHPFLWGTRNGASPATLTYHLEHTLFPGLSYELLPKIAPVVRQTCQQFGIPYHGLYSTQDLLRARYAKLALYSSKIERKKEI